MSILVANIGSTSFKYRLYAADGERVLGEGRVERIGQPGSACPDYDTAIQGAIDRPHPPGRPAGQSVRPGRHRLQGRARRTRHRRSSDR